MSEKTVFAVNDMTCGHCVSTVRKALEAAFPGAEVSVDLATHRAEFVGNADKGAEVIREAGYTPEAV